MWVKQCHKPPMTGNGDHTTYKNGDDWGMFFLLHGFTQLIFTPLRVGWPLTPQVYFGP